jgi:hypothetical protein
MGWVQTLILILRAQFFYIRTEQGRGVHVTGVSAAYTFKLNKNILSE